MKENVSIIIAAYNAQATLPRTLQSLSVIPTEQRQHVEIVAVNDGSKDNTGDMLDQACAMMTGFRWRLIHQDNAGLSGARNTALAQATGDWLYFLDADDELATDLTALIDHHGQATCIGMTLTYHRMQQGQLRLVRQVRPIKVTPANRLKVFSAENPFQPSSLLFRSRCVSKRFDLSVNVVNDWLFWMENPELFTEMVIEPKIVGAHIHIHENNMSSRYAEAGRHRQRVAEIMLEKTAGSLPVVARNNFELQKQIGSLQQGFRPRCSSFFKFPCSPVLYAKYLIYLAAWLTSKRASWY